MARRRIFAIFNRQRRSAGYLTTRHCLHTRGSEYSGSGLNRSRGPDRRFHRVLIETVAESPYRPDERRIRRIGFDLLAQAQDVYVYRAIRHGAIMPPNSIQQLFAAVNHPWAAHQELEQPEFRRGEGYFGPAQR